MSTIADQVFEKLRAGESPRDIRKSVKSATRFVEGLQKNETWAIARERIQMFSKVLVSKDWGKRAS